MLLQAGLAFGKNTVLVPAGSRWRYLADGSEPGAGWKDSSAQARDWSLGRAELGFGDGGEMTDITPVQGVVTTYFQRVFTCRSPSQFTELLVRLVRDDGAIVYLNGVELGRSNMPTGDVNGSTKASALVFDRSEGDFRIFRAPPTALRRGINILAVEVHQAGLVDDLSFDCELIASTMAEPAFVTRGPYLQNGAQDGVTIRWRTDSPTSSLVRWGTNRRRLPNEKSDPGLRTEHELRVTGLQSGRRYTYAIGAGSEVIEGNDGDHWFRTVPEAGDPAPVRVWIIGDSGTGGDGSGRAEAVRNGYRRSRLYRHADVWLMLGDNAYNIGLDSEFQAAVFETYRSTLINTLLWPAIGNHETYANGPTIPYFDIFTLPTQGEAGGLPSGTENYYSFDYGQVHFVCLDSMISSRQPGSPMLTWLEQDLASTTRRWIIAYWHHPPYTHGSHNSDFELELVEMRMNVLPILESYGVDLVLSGHSHSYERSCLVDGHYGTSNTLTPLMLVDRGDGQSESNGAYQKAAGPHAGTVYTVCGVSGQVSGGTYDHPIMVSSLPTLGSMCLEIRGPRLDASFVDYLGVERDSFTIEKGAQ